MNILIVFLFSDMFISMKIVIFSNADSCREIKTYTHKEA